MDQATLLHHVSNALTLTLILSLPALLIAAAIGIGVGLLQAVTQIQDQSLPQALKLIAVLLVLVFMGPRMVGPLVEHAEQVFGEFWTLGR